MISIFQLVCDSFYKNCKLGQWLWFSRAVASDTRGTRFVSSHRQTFISDIYLFTVNCTEKMKIKKKRLGMAHFKKKSFCRWPLWLHTIIASVIVGLLYSISFTNKTLLGQEPWSSGYWRRRMFQRSWVWIPTLYTRWTWHFSHLFVVKIVMMCVWKDGNKWKRGRGWPIFLKKKHYLLKFVRITCKIHALKLPCFVSQPFLF